MKPPAPPAFASQPPASQPKPVPSRDGFSRNAVVLPARNEARFIGHVLKGLQLARPDDALVVIDDASTDDTARIAREAGAVVVRLPFHGGYGVALQTGIKYALWHGFTTAVTFDADGQHEARDMGALLAALDTEGADGGGLDIAIGSRYRAAQGFENPPHKRLAVWFFSRVTRAATGLAITDSTSGFRAYNRRAMRFYATDALPDRFPDADAVIMAHRAGLRLGEVPVRMYLQPTKVSMHAGVKAVAYVFNMLFSILVTVLRRDDAGPVRVEPSVAPRSAPGAAADQVRSR
jgi:glycosyltransferase involved in cell wall biosynthesis